MGWKRVGVGALFATVVCAAHAANPQTKECAWTAVPATERNALLGAYSTGGSDGLGTVQIGDLTIRAIAFRCGLKNVDSSELRTVSVAIAGSAMRYGAAQLLNKRGVGPLRLDEIWRKDDKRRNALLNAMSSGDRSPEAAKQLYLAVAELVRQAGGTVPSSGDPMHDPGFRPFADYFTGRALEELSSTTLHF